MNENMSENNDAWKNAGYHALDLLPPSSEIDWLRDRVKWLERIIFLNRFSKYSKDGDMAIQATIQAEIFYALNMNDTYKKLAKEWEESKVAWNAETGLSAYNDKLNKTLESQSW